MSFKRVRWKPGTVYAIRLTDGSFGICQAIDTMMPDVIYIAVFSYRFDKVPDVVPVLDSKDVLNLGATWKQSLNNGTWAGLGEASPVAEKSDFPNEQFAHDGYIGAKHSDVGIYSNFLSACFGLIPWNTMFDPNYWEEYLNTPHIRPESIKILSKTERKKYRFEVMGIKNA